MWRANRLVWRSWPDSQITALLEAGQIGQEDAEEWTMIRAMDDAAFESWLESWLLSHGLAGGRYTRPHFLEDSAFNAPLQPVVGVCWHEACAYCAWLSAQTDRIYRLPTEHEREAATRGQARRPYAYVGQFDPAKGNTSETRLKRTTPAGVFPDGDTPEGISDLTGNSVDWTSSPYTDRGEIPSEAAAAWAGDDASRVRRLTCGASWCHIEYYAHAAHRMCGDPDWRQPGLGFRVVCDSPIG
jgi:formylglycine-generating enzyme required for sulfatase activity